MNPPRKHVVEYYRASDVMTPDEIAELSYSPTITFGDGNVSLVTVQRICDALDVIPSGIQFLDRTAYIDVEN